MITAPQIMSVSSANPANVCISTELHLRNPKPGIKEQIVEMVHNGAGVRDSSRTLKVDINTVILTL